MNILPTPPTAKLSFLVKAASPIPSSRVPRAPRTTPTLCYTEPTAPIFDIVIRNGSPNERKPSNGEQKRKDRQNGIPDEVKQPSKTASTPPQTQLSPKSSYNQPILNITNQYQQKPSYLYIDTHSIRLSSFPTSEAHQNSESKTSSWFSETNAPLPDDTFETVLEKSSSAAQYVSQSKELITELEKIRDHYVHRTEDSHVSYSTRQDAVQLLNKANWFADILKACRLKSLNVQKAEILGSLGVSQSDILTLKTSNPQGQESTHLTTKADEQILAYNRLTKQIIEIQNNELKTIPSGTWEIRLKTTENSKITIKTGIRITV